MVFLVALRLSALTLTVNGFLSAFRDGAAETINVFLDEAEMALAHRLRIVSRLPTV